MVARTDTSDTFCACTSLSCVSEKRKRKRAEGGNKREKVSEVSLLSPPQHVAWGSVRRCGAQFTQLAPPALTPTPPGGQLHPFISRVNDPFDSGRSSYSPRCGLPRPSVEAGIGSNPVGFGKALASGQPG